MKQKSLLNFFTKKQDTTPSKDEGTVAKRKQSELVKTPGAASNKRLKNDDKENVDQTSIMVCSDSSEDEKPVVGRNRLRQKKTIQLIGDSSDDDEKEWNPSKVDDSESSEEESIETPVKAAPSKAAKSQSVRKKSSFKTPVIVKRQKTAPATAPPNIQHKSNTTGVLGPGSYPHDKLVWLHEARRDANMKKPTEKDFDPRTLYVPADFLKKQTPAMQQWWEIKRLNMDTVLFFKVGKFYELFHMDSDVGFKHLGLNYMKGEKAHTGFPEIAYGKFSSTLVQKGFKVARVEQTETPEMMKARKTKAKVVRREMCSLLTPGTNTQCFLDGKLNFVGADVQGDNSSVSRQSLLLSLKEEIHSEDDITYGLCVVDCTTGMFRLGEISDSKQRDRLRTILTQFDIAEVVHERDGLHPDTKRMIQYALPQAITSDICSFWDSGATIEEIKKAEYFDNGWPKGLEKYLEKPIVMSALGGCIFFLRQSIIERELLSLKLFSDLDYMERDFALIDAHTVRNLEILSSNGQAKGSVLYLLDKTVTGFGRRLFRDWVLKPLCRVNDINRRLDAVEDFHSNRDLMDDLRSKLKKLPDLQRLLCRIHTLGSSHRAKDHPDSRAIMYETPIYNQRKIKDFHLCLEGFEQAQGILESIKSIVGDFKSSWLKQLLTIKYNEASDATFPDMIEQLNYFKNAYDQEHAKKNGVIAPYRGIDSDYDDACDLIKSIEEKFDEYLKEQRKVMMNHKISYWGKKTEDRYQLEVPEEALRRQPSEYEVKSKKKGYKRFHTPFIRKLLKELIVAEERKKTALVDQMRRIFNQFASREAMWLKAIECLSTLDCLLSLAAVSAYGDGYTRPIVYHSTNPALEIRDGIHPCVSKTFDNGEFIPNDTVLGDCTTQNHPLHDSDDPVARMTLLSGPNMGGKSTLLRQNCILVLMAQIGCFVPASKCLFTPVDRIFTRIGASDRILEGQSTFYVELAETATILNCATTHSLVILDELGRGTSTFDGTAIAYSVVEHLVRQIGCRAMFATHYHSLVEEYVYDPKVALGHMDCVVNADESKVTFLYKLVEGMCPKSYGINVARLAGLPEEVVTHAAKKSQEFEQALLQFSKQSDALAKSTYQTLQELVNDPEPDLIRIRTIWRQLHSRI